jgi:hypothetical protein
MGVGGSKAVRFAICDLRMTPEKAATATLLIGYRKSAIANGSISDGGRLPICDSQITTQAATPLCQSQSEIRSRKWLAVVIRE